MAQYKLINMLYTNLEADIPDERSLCVVGDVDQSIYSWRGADYTIILNFQKDFKKTKLIKLEQNYRSTANILNVANAIIENNTERVDKVLYSQKGDGELIDYFEAQDEADEANFIASKIKQDSGTGARTRAMLLLDYVALEKTPLPAVAEDSVSIKQIEDKSLLNILELFNSSEKQCFIAIDKANSYSSGHGVPSILYETRVIELSEGHELYGRAWNKKMR